MKKFLSKIFALLAGVLIVVALALCVTSLNGPIRLIGTTQAQDRMTRQFLEAVCGADLETASGFLAGQQKLTKGEAFQEAYTDLLWETYWDSMTYEFSGSCYPDREGLARDVTVTALDLSGVLDQAAALYPALLEQRWNEAAPAENSQPSGEFALAVFQDTLTGILDAEVPTLQKKLSLHLVFQEGRWRIQPDEALIQWLSGAMAQA